MLTVDPSKRITWQELFNHPLLKPIVSKDRQKVGAYNELLINSSAFN